MENRLITLLVKGMLVEDVPRIRVSRRFLVMAYRRRRIHRKIPRLGPEKGQLGRCLYSGTV